MDVHRSSPLSTVLFFEEIVRFVQFMHKNLIVVAHNFLPYVFSKKKQLYLHKDLPKHLVKWAMNWSISVKKFVMNFTDNSVIL